MFEGPKKIYRKIKEFWNTTQAEQLRLLKVAQQKATEWYYNVHFLLTKIIERYGRPVNTIVDTVTVIAALWCLGNIVWQIGFHVTPETETQLLIINRRLIGVFSIIQIYKLLNYIRSSSFDPLKALMQRFDTAPFRKVIKKNPKGAIIILWRKFKRLFSLHHIGHKLKVVFNYLFVGNRVPLMEVTYAILTCLYFWFMPGIDETTTGWVHAMWGKWGISVAVVVISVNELSRLGITFLGRKTSPTVLFIGSFLVIIFIGTLLLMMPKCNNGNLTFFDALFTATSAVCVNGLSIIDISTDLTWFGQFIVLILIQVGGIGVMTFTCFFALSLTGKASLQNQYVIKDLVSADNLNDIFTMLKRIFYVTLVIELLCGLFLFYYMQDRVGFLSTGQLAFYSAFHAISAFCNAGFSNIEGGMMNEYIVNVKPLQVVMGITIILGGLGFPLQSSVIEWVKHHVKLFVHKVVHRSYRDKYHSRLINATNRMVFFTHLGLVVAGIVIFMVTESRYTQSEKGIMDSLCDSFFMSVCSRTAGFNTIDLTTLGPVTLMMITIFMWIGCAPMSTGGGVKVTTFAVALLNVKAALQRKDSIDVYGRRINQASILKAFSVIAISGFVMVLCAVLFKMFDPQIGMSKLLFESCSAVFTGGMTLDVTTHLSMPSHIVLLVEMFIGRIGILSFAMCFLDPAPKQYYKYPYENVMI